MYASYVTRMRDIFLLNSWTTRSRNCSTTLSMNAESYVAIDFQGLENVDIECNNMIA